MSHWQQEPARRSPSSTAPLLTGRRAGRGNWGADMDVFVARQPVLGANRKVAAYELLYRSTEAVDLSEDADLATSRLLVNACLTLGIGTLTNGLPAYVGFTREGLLSEYPTLVPPDRLVVQILEGVEPDSEVVAACGWLKQLGYQLALDGVANLSDSFEEFCRLVDIIKVDFLRADQSVRRDAALIGRRYGALLLAEEVDHADDLAEAEELGYLLYQGYFFQQPSVVAGRQLDASQRSHALLLREVNARVLNRDQIERTIKNDFSISYQLLKYLNSAAFAWRRPITDVHQALVALGERDLRKWLSVLCLNGVAGAKPPEVVVQSVVRALFCEAAAELVGLRSQSNELFMTGLFSLLDAILDQPLHVCLQDVPVSSETRDALFFDSGPYAPVLSLAKAAERGDWNQLRAHAERLGVQPFQLAEPYVTAVRLGDELMRVE